MEPLTQIAIFLAGGVLFWIGARAYYWHAAIGKETAAAIQDSGIGMLVIDGQGRVSGSRNLAAIFQSASAITTLTEILKCCESASQDDLNVKLQAARKGDMQPLMLRLSGGRYVDCTFVQWDMVKGQMTMLVQDATNRQRQINQFGLENQSMKDDLRRFSTVLNTADLLVWVRDRELKIIYCNLAYTKAIEDVGMDVIDAGIPELSKLCLPIARRALEKAGEQLERVHLIIGGNRRLFRVREVHVKELGYNIGYAIDITDLEDAEHQIADYTAAQEDFLESASSAMAMFTGDTRIKYYNQAFVRMWGYDEQWLDTSPKFGEMLEFLRTKRRLPEEVNFKAYKEHRLRLFSDLIEPREELHFLPDGRTIRSVAIPNHAGGVLLNYEDVTDRLALERNYNTMLAVQRETIDNLHEGVVVFGEDGRVRLINPVFLKIWGLSEKDIVERMHVSEVLERLKDLLMFDDWDDFKQTFIGRLQSRRIEGSRLERKDEKVLEWSCVPLPDGGSLLSYTDITDSTLVERSLRELNDALAAADRLKSEFLANVSYELRSPLTSITGFSEMLRQNYFGELNDRQREYIENIHVSSRQLMELIDNILDLASIEAGYMTLAISDFDIYKMLNSTLMLIKERTKHFNVHTKLKCKKTIGIMKGDETRVRQVLFHLLSNAVKYSKEDSTIELGAEKDSKGVKIWVRDEGAGIGAEEMGLVFNKFYRGRAGSGKSGTGLGLSMVKSFIELHGGHVSISSSASEGTMVTCFIPADLENYGLTTVPLEESPKPAKKAATTK